MDDSDNPYGVDVDQPVGGFDPDTPLAGDDGDEQAEMPDDMMIVDGDISCDECAHQDVCAVYANFAPQVAQEIPQRTGGEPAFEPGQLAVICDHFDQI